MIEDQKLDTFCGYVAIVGRPNVGKSTLMNHILGQKISITSRKPQTTRHQIVGIYTEDKTQVIFVDTPGMHRGQEKAINKVMNRAADSALADVDAVLMVVDRTVWADEDQWVLDKLKHVKAPVYLVINKIDHLENKESLLPHIEKVSEKFDFKEVLPISALRGHNLDRLIEILSSQMPRSLYYYPEDQVTDRSQRFMASEIIREKLMRQLGAELPYSTAVEIEQFKFEDRVLHLHGLILVERSGQKRIVIGDKGARLKQVGQEARLDMESLFETKV
ncbi:GTPase Era, partial [Reinekea sp.]